MKKFYEDRAQYLERYRVQSVLHRRRSTVSLLQTCSYDHKESKYVDQMLFSRYAFVFVGGRRTVYVYVSGSTHAALTPSRHHSTIVDWDVKVTYIER